MPNVYDTLVADFEAVKIFIVKNEDNIVDEEATLMRFFLTLCDYTKSLAEEN